jgi:DNA polymerase III sliding clamp (beta) subunit (PCNA family)
MKCTLHSAALQTAAGLANKTAGTRPRAPIFGAALLVAEGGDRLTVTASTDGAWTRTSYQAEVQTGSTVAVSARLLAAAAAGMPAGRLDIVTDGASLTISGSGRNRAVLPLMPAEDYPSWPVTAEGRHLSVPGPALAAALDVAARIASADSTIGHAEIRRVQLVGSAAGLRVLASDRYRLICLDLPWSTTVPLAGPVEVAIDPTVVGPLVALAKASDVVTLSVPDAGGANMLEVGIGPARSLTAVVGGQSVDYGRFLAGAKRDRSVLVDSDDLLNLIAHVAPFVLTTETTSGKLKGPALIGIDGDQLTLRAGSEADGLSQGSVEVEGWDGEVWETGLNPAYLADVVKAIAAPRVRLWVASPKDPLYLTRPDGPAPAQAVLMPIRIPSTGRTQP